MDVELTVFVKKDVEDKMDEKKVGEVVWQGEMLCEGHGQSNPNLSCRIVRTDKRLTIEYTTQKDAMGVPCWLPLDSCATGGQTIVAMLTTLMHVLVGALER
jgi:hypothetical protein